MRQPQRLAHAADGANTLGVWSPSAASVNPTRCWRGTTTLLTRRLRAKEAMANSNIGTPLFLLPGGLTPKVQPCDGIAHKVVTSNMTALYDHIHGFPRHQARWPRLPEAPLQGATDAVGKESLG